MHLPSSTQTYKIHTKAMSPQAKCCCATAVCCKICHLYCSLDWNSKCIDFCVTQPHNIMNERHQLWCYHISLALYVCLNAICIPPTHLNAKTDLFSMRTANNLSFSLSLLLAIALSSSLSTSIRLPFCGRIRVSSPSSSSLLMFFFLFLSISHVEFSIRHKNRHQI